jgi:hypothetical protein
MKSPAAHADHWIDWCSFAQVSLQNVQLKACNDALSIQLNSIWSIDPNQLNFAVEAVDDEGWKKRLLDAADAAPFAILRDPSSKSKPRP